MRLVTDCDSLYCRSGAIFTVLKSSYYTWHFRFPAKWEYFHYELAAAANLAVLILQGIVACFY